MHGSLIISPLAASNTTILLTAWDFESATAANEVIALDCFG